jgi:SRSO17 transposase
VAELALPAVTRSGPVEAWIIDDTGFPKKGRHSVGVTRQYCGQLGKQDNCQVAVSLSLANHDASLPVAYRLYLPEDWAQDQARRDKAKSLPRRKPGCRRRLFSKPSLRSPWGRSKRRGRRGCPRAWC